MALQIRPARPRDIDEMAETAIAAWRQGFSGIVPDWVDPESAWRPEQIEARIAAPDDERTVLVAEVDGAVQGLVLCGPSRDAGAPPSEGEVIALYVHPRHWRRGHGRALVGASLERLAGLGFSEVIVWTLAGSPRNLAFYESLGFHRDGGSQRRESFGSPLEVRFRRSLEDR